MKKIIIISISLLLLTACFSGQEEKLGGYTPTQNLVISSGGGIEIYTGAGVSSSMIINNTGNVAIGANAIENVKTNINGDIGLLSKGRIFVPNDFTNLTCNQKCANHITTKNTSGTGAFLCLSSLNFTSNAPVSPTLTTACSTNPGAGVVHVCLCFGEID